VVVATVVVSAIIVVVVVTVMVIVAEAVMVPAMVMLEAAVWTIPITHEVVPTFPAGTYPMRSSIRRARPIAIVPEVAPPCRIPITVDPKIIGAGAQRVDSYYAGRRRDSDGDAHRYLGVHGRTT
jgi:hypothetical protein